MPIRLRWNAKRLGPRAFFERFYSALVDRFVQNLEGTLIDLLMDVVIVYADMLGLPESLYILGPTSGPEGVLIDYCGTVLDL